MAEPGMTETIPLALNEDGVLRVSGRRVTLDTVVGAFREGATPEEMRNSIRAFRWETSTR